MDKIHNDPTCPCHEWSAKSPSESPQTPEGDAGFLVPEAKNVSQGDSGAGMTHLTTRSKLRAALFDVIDSGWQCGHPCDIKHPWHFDPYAEDDAETEHRTRFVDTVMERVNRMTTPPPETQVAQSETDDSGIGGDEPFCQHGNLLWSEDCDECARAYHQSHQGRTVTKMPSDKDKWDRAKRLTKIRQAVAHVENRLAVDPSGNNDAIRALYYLARLAKKAK